VKDIKLVNFTRVMKSCQLQLTFMRMLRSYCDYIATSSTHNKPSCQWQPAKFLSKHHTVITAENVFVKTVIGSEQLHTRSEMHIYLLLCCQN